MAEAAWLSYGTAFGFFALLNSLLPSDLRPPLRRWIESLLAFFSPYIHYTVPEFHGSSTNELFSSVELYLSDIAANLATNITLSTAKNATNLTFALEESSDAVPDKSFRPAGGGEFTAEWSFRKEKRQAPSMMMSFRGGVEAQDEKRSLDLRVKKKERERVRAYVEHVMQKAKVLKREREERHLYTNKQGRDGYSMVYGKLWESVPFKHPATFETLAMDPEEKARIMEDLTEFKREGAEFYKRAGRAWKRGYLLYGPPGTGKSSMIAAIANFLHYDVYDLELTEVKTNLALKNLLLKTGDRSVIVIEDIDCTLDLTKYDRRSTSKPRPKSNDLDLDLDSPVPNQVTLSGLLNFIDGLWSCCGDERIFIFTTNHIDKLDPALIRSGRMDRHIHLSYCCFPAFKTLAHNYLQIHEHPLFEEIRRAIAEEGALMTPAEISEVLTREKRDVDRALCCLLEELRESKAKRKKEEEKQARELVKQKQKEKEEQKQEEEEEEKTPQEKN